MDIRFQAGGPSKWKADAVISFVFEGEDAEQACSCSPTTANWRTGLRIRAGICPRSIMFW